MERLIYIYYYLLYKMECFTDFPTTNNSDNLTGAIIYEYLTSK